VGDSGRVVGKNSDALDAGGAHAVTIGNIPSLEWFQDFKMGNIGGINGSPKKV